MTALYQSPFLIALGWSIAESLWQAALLWLMYQLLSNTFFKNSPSLKHAAAVCAVFGAFIWFGATLVQHYSDIASLSQSVANISENGLTTAQAILAITDAGFADSQLMRIANTFLPYFSTAYLIVLLVLSIKLCNAYIYSRQLRTKGLIEVDSYWANFVSKYAKRIGISRKVKIYFSGFIDVPATLDFFKPVILIPVAAFNHLTTEQVESVLLHELAHIRRNDYLVNIIISVIETILFFNPFVLLLGKSLKKEREHCCDDLVLHYKFDPHSYASALLSLEKMRIGFQTVAVAATGNSNQLLGRVKRIMNVKSTNFNYGQKLLALAVIAFILISIAWLSPNKDLNTAPQPEKKSTDVTENNTWEPMQRMAATNEIHPQKPISTQPDITVQKTISAIKKTTSTNNNLAHVVEDNINTLSAPPPPPPIFTPPVPAYEPVRNVYTPDGFTIDAPVFEQPHYDWSKSWNVPFAKDMSGAFSSEWKANEENMKLQMQHFQLLDDATKKINAIDTKKIIQLFEQVQKESQLKQVELEALMQNNFRKLVEPKKKLAPAHMQWFDRLLKQKILIDSAQNKNKLLQKKAERQKAIWVRNDEHNNASVNNNLYFASNVDVQPTISLGYVAMPDITADNNSHAERAVTVMAHKSKAAQISARTKTVKVTAVNAYTMDYCPSPSTATISSTREARTTKKLIINDEKSSTSLIITIEE